MINLYLKDSSTPIGSISDEELQYMVEQLEEESLEDRDYAITPMEIQYFETHGASPHLLDLLRQALGGRDEVTLRWSRA